MQDRLPERMRWMFPSVEFDELDVERDADSIIASALDLGDIEDWRWTIGRFGAERLRAVVRTSRSISRVSANFWRVYFDLDPEEVFCLSTRCRETFPAVWPY